MYKLTASIFEKIEYLHTCITSTCWAPLEATPEVFQSFSGSICDIILFQQVFDLETHRKIRWQL